MQEWYEVADVEDIDSPALLIFTDRIRSNIKLIKEMLKDDCSRLRPHVKTNKMVEVCQMMIVAGIEQFKCATIAEAEMLALANAKDVLLAYQPVGPKLKRWLLLVQEYPNTHFSCVVDNVKSIQELGNLARCAALNLCIYLDVDIGMGRTGASLSHLPQLWNAIKVEECLSLEGVHGYDGHIHNPDVNVRLRESELSYNVLRQAYDFLEVKAAGSLKMIIGGSPSFTAHAQRKDVVCSPGTFVFWDWGYRENIGEQEFEYAAALLTRVVSVVDDRHICVDLGYKAVASDPPLTNRVLFLNAEDAEVAFQSEEHLVLSVKDIEKYPIGKVLYAVPRHVCPTVNLYDCAYVVHEGHIGGRWQVIGRNRKLNI